LKRIATILLLSLISAILILGSFPQVPTLAEKIPATWIGDSAHVSTSAVLSGDANRDGVVNNLDITKVERIIVGLD